MASKRGVRRKSCEGKRRYESRQEARWWLSRYTAERGYAGHMNVYRCQFCGGWHMGHAKRR